MSFIQRHARTLAVAVSCLGVGAGAGVIANAGASTTSTTHAAKPAAKTAWARGRRGLLRRAVQGQLVVHTQNGFETVSFERGYVQSVSGDSLTLREGTKNATYKIVTLTIPSSARVRNNGATSSLSALTSGEHVGVIQGPANTWVVARSVK